MLSSICAAFRAVVSSSSWRAGSLFGGSPVVSSPVRIGSSCCAEGSAPPHQPTASARAARATVALFSGRSGRWSPPSNAGPSCPRFSHTGPPRISPVARPTSAPAGLVAETHAAQIGAPLPGSQSRCRRSDTGSPGHGRPRRSHRRARARPLFLTRATSCPRPMRAECSGSAPDASLVLEPCTITASPGVAFALLFYGCRLTTILSDAA